MIVEFVGPPGAGKSTIAGELSRLTGQPSFTLDGFGTVGGRALTRREVEIQRWWALASQPHLAREAVTCARREGRGLALSWMINLARRNRMMGSLKDKDVILEEGTLSALCLAKAARSRAWDVLSVLPRLSYGRIIVAVDIDIDTAVERIQMRQGILADKDASSLRRLVSRYQAALSQLSGVLDPAPIRVSSNRPPTSVADQLRESLR